MAIKNPLYKSSGIYRIVNTITGDCYIGSATTFQSRKDTHFSSLKRNKHHSIIFQRAWNKYGKDNFIFEVIEKCAIKDLMNLEQRYLDELQPKYNICKIAGRTFGVVSKLRKIVIQYSLMGEFIKEWPSLESASQFLNLRSSSSIRRCCSGELRQLKGFVWKNKTDPFVAVRPRKGKPVVELNNKGEIIGSWERAIDCVNEVGIDKGVLSQICDERSTLHTYKGRVFKRR